VENISRLNYDHHLSSRVVIRGVKPTKGFISFPIGQEAQSAQSDDFIRYRVGVILTANFTICTVKSLFAYACPTSVMDLPNLQPANRARPITDGGPKPRP
jgi:hypothetical protein